MSARYDAAVVGAGILGLAHAYHLARRGRRVVVFERGARATGASIRNFGMLWPIGQPHGHMHGLARRSVEIWLEVLSGSGLWHDRCGSIHLAYRDDEAQVLTEFAGTAAANGYDCRLLSPAEVRERAPAVRSEGLCAGLWSPTEVCVDPRAVVPGLAAWLAAAHGVHFEFSCAVAAYDRPRLRAGGREWSAERLVVCAGDDLQSLFPDALGGLGLVRCKLQMLRSAPMPAGWRIGPMLAGGLTLTHYQSFRTSPSLPALVARIEREQPAYRRHGIHVMVSQHAAGELTIGDSHEYGDAITPFDQPEIDDLVLRYLAGFLDAPGLRIAARWHGIYAKHPSEPYTITQPAPGVTAVTGVGGAGMTLSFGLAEEVVRGMG
jgi:FAD dependent oxidoreductase TIGR03364